MAASSSKYPLLGLHLLLAVYSLSAVLSKFASGYSPLSIEFCLLYGGVLVLLFLYALAWQQILKRMPLTTAFANKAVTVIWGIVWGLLLFGEAVTVGKVVGALLIVVGIVLFSYADDQQVEAAGGEG